MRQAFISHTLDFILKNNPTVTKEQIEKLQYGIESLYILITKFIVLFLISLFLGITGDFILIVILYNILRYPAFGFHAGNSFMCFILSATLFLGLPYLLLQIEIDPPFYYIILGVSLCCFLLFAPADTEKRPLTNKRKRVIRKIVATILASIYILGILFLQDTIFSKYLFIALVLETIAILPITYWIFGQKYANYKKV